MSDALNKLKITHYDCARQKEFIDAKLQKISNAIAQEEFRLQVEQGVKEAEKKPEEPKA